MISPSVLFISSKLTFHLEYVFGTLICSKILFLSPYSFLLSFLGFVLLGRLSRTNPNALNASCAHSWLVFVLHSGKTLLRFLHENVSKQDSPAATRKGDAQNSACSTHPDYCFWRVGCYFNDLYIVVLSYPNKMLYYRILWRYYKENAECSFFSSSLVVYMLALISHSLWL